MCVLILLSNTSQATVYTNANLITIVDNAAANPFPSVISVSGTTSAITNITVTINGLSHPWVHDVSLLLQAPSGESLLLQSGVADGFGVSNLTYTFSDAAPAQLSDVNTYSNGTYKPTGYFWDMFDSPAPPTPPGFNTYQTPGPFGSNTATLASVFNGLSANGDWKLFVQDFADGDAGEITGGWSIDITTGTPPPCPTDIIITGNYAQTLTESDTWIKGDAVLTFDPSVYVALEADSNNGYILFEPITVNDFMIAEPLSSGAMLAEITDGCSPLKPNSQTQLSFVENKTVLYPNPFSISFLVKNAAWHHTMIHTNITSVEGKSMLQLDTQTQGDQLNINMSSLPNGMYLLHLQYDNQREVLKMIKEN